MYSIKELPGLLVYIMVLLHCNQKLDNFCNYQNQSSVEHIPCALVLIQPLAMLLCDDNYLLISSMCSGNELIVANRHCPYKHMIRSAYGLCCAFSRKCCWFLFFAISDRLIGLALMPISQGLVIFMWMTAPITTMMTDGQLTNYLILTPCACMLGNQYY